MRTNLKSELARLAQEHGMASVLATLRNIIQAEADECAEMGNPEDDATAEKLEAIASKVLHAGADYDALGEMVA